jgi:Transposase IS4
MEDQFDPSWINCLDESMMEWLNQFTCPGFMCVGRKPHPFGNERHTICCALSTIMWHAEIVEGKDRPTQLGQKEFNDLGGPTVGLMVHMTKPIHHTGKVVVMDSGFCVAKGIVEMEKKGVYGQALIKKSDDIGPNLFLVMKLTSDSKTKKSAVLECVRSLWIQVSPSRSSALKSLTMS